MSYASDNLYKRYFRRNMPTIVSKVKVREIVPHLPCLTDHDRENIEAKREMNGNYDSMILLLDCLKRRENWPEQFIAGLEACDHTILAAEIRAEYNALRNINNSNPSSPPTNVIRAHVHPAPSASHLSVPESGGNSQTAAVPPAKPSAPPEPAARASPTVEIPVQPQAPQSSAAKVPEAVAPPEPVAEPPRSTQIEVAPPPSAPSPPIQREINSHQEPVENSESDIQYNPGNNDVIPDEVPAGNGEVMINSVATQPSSRVETDAPSRPDPLQATTTTTTTAEIRPPQSPSPTQRDSDVTDGSSFPLKTPEKPPVQDTTPPAVVPQPKVTSGPPAKQVVDQVVKSSPQTEAAATTSALPGAAGMDASVCDDSTVCLSKPGELISIHPQNHDSPTIPAPSSPVGPYSGDSERLEISDSLPDAVTSAHVPACSAVSSTTMNAVSALPCQENGIAPNHNEPEENQYESPCQSLEMQDVRVNVGQISEEPSILDLDGQSSIPQAQIVNGEAAKEIASASPPSSNNADTVSGGSNPPCEKYHPSEPVPADVSPVLKTLQDSEKKNFPHTMTANTKYILTAAGVGAFALLMAWKFKN